ncbi:MAG TPA: hypothetical protein VG982_03120 [Candidatus Paceibacterota bacterium]|nr:hypothetical protein [Candidatus Paceibacterota bacterium]
MVVQEESNFECTSRLNDPTAIEKTVLNSKRAKKQYQKRKEGTDGIDTVCEKSSEENVSDRLKDAYDMMRDD